MQIRPAAAVFSDQVTQAFKIDAYDDNDNDNGDKRSVHFNGAAKCMLIMHAILKELQVYGN